MIELLDTLPHSCRMNTKASFIQSNLRYLMGEMSPTDLHRATGVPQPTIHRIIIGESEDPKTATLQPIADHFGISVSDLRDRDLQGGERPTTMRQLEERARAAEMELRRILKEATAELRVVTVYRLAEPDSRKVIDSAVDDVIESLDLTTLLNKRK